MRDIRWNHKIIRFEKSYEIRIKYFPGVDTSVTGYMEQHTHLFVRGDFIEGCQVSLPVDATLAHIAEEEHKSIMRLLDDRKQKVSHELTFLMELTEGLNND